MDKIGNQDQAKDHLRSLGLFVDEEVVRRVVTAISRGDPVYRLWKGAPNRSAICAKGTVDKIKKFCNQGLLRSYIDYLHLDQSLELVDSENVQDPVMTGIQSLDELTGGMNPGDILILGGPPAIGKSTLALNVVINVAKTGLGVVLISLESPPDRKKLALISSEPKTTEQKVQLNIYTDADDEQMLKAIRTVSAFPIYTISTREVNVEKIRENVRIFSTGISLRLVVVDSLQRITNSGVEARRNNEIMLGLKSMAQEFEIPVLVLSQLEYVLSGETDPGLSVLPLEVANHADVVMLLHNEAEFTGFKGYDIPEKEKGILQITVAKNRRGPKGRTKVVFDEKTLKFREPTRRET